jgi:hypothetical protein
MTPKEKAAELMKLFDIKYLRIISFTGKAIPVSMYDDQIKECALLAVDLIIAQIEPSVSMDVIIARIKYWQEVKKEIELL